jgi:nucleoside-diphosphate-sugar epimerase
MRYPNSQEVNFSTGFAGFVSNHMLNYLNAKGTKSLVLGVDTERPQFPFDECVHLDCDFRALDLHDRNPFEKGCT